MRETDWPHARFLGAVLAFEILCSAVAIWCSVSVILAGGWWSLLGVAMLAASSTTLVFVYEVFGGLRQELEPVFRKKEKAGKLPLDDWGWE